MMELLLIHAVATWFMTGLIWFVQVVHYPLFDRVGIEGYTTYQQRHMDLTSWVIGPMMLVGGLTGICILFFDLGFLSSVLVEYPTFGFDLAFNHRVADATTQCTCARI